MENESNFPLNQRNKPLVSPSYTGEKQGKQPQMPVEQTGKYRRGLTPLAEYRFRIGDIDYRKSIRMAGVPTIKKSNLSSLEEAETFFVSVQMKRDDLKLNKLQDWYPALKYFKMGGNENTYGRTICYPTSSPFIMDIPLPQNESLPNPGTGYMSPAVQSIYHG